MYKTSEGCNFSRGFGYMRRGSERRDVTIRNPSAFLRHLQWNPPLGHPPAPNTPGTFPVYRIQRNAHTENSNEEKGRNNAGLQRGKTFSACWVQRNIHHFKRHLAASAHGTHRR